MLVQQAWLYVPVTNELLFAPAKGGSQSLYTYVGGLLGYHDIPQPRLKWLRENATGQFEILLPADAAEHPCNNRRQYVADPIRRFESLWRGKCRDKEGGVPTALQGVSPDALLDYIIANDGANVHWQHQHVHQIPGSSLSPIESLGTKVHTSSGAIPEYDERKLREFYARDFELYTEVRTRFRSQDFAR